MKEKTMSEYISLEKYKTILANTDPLLYTGNVNQVVGLTIESRGPAVELDEVCQIYSLKGDNYIYAEVVGFRDENVLLMPFGDLQGIGPGSLVVATRKPFMIPVGEKLLGRVIDGLGSPMDGK